MHSSNLARISASILQKLQAICSVHLSMISDQLQDASLSTLDTDQFTAANDFFLQLVKIRQYVSKSLDRGFKCLPECCGSGLRIEVGSQHAAQQNIGTSDATNLIDGRQVAS